MLRPAFPVLFGAVLALAGAPPAAAQEEGAGQDRMYVVVSHFTVDPADAPAFTAAVVKIRQAARDASLGEEFAWEFYRDGNDFYLVSFRESMAAFDDEGAFMRQFEGKPARATLEAAFAELETLGYAGRNTVLRYVPEWSYMPETPAVRPGQHEGVYVIDNWWKPGKEEAFDQSTKRIMGMLREVGYPYPVFGHRTVIGDMGHGAIVVAHDGLSDFFGEKGLMTLLETRGKTEAWEKIVGERQALLRDTETSMSMYLPELSYSPATEAGEPMEGGSN